LIQVLACWLQGLDATMMAWKFGQNICRKCPTGTCAINK
jgi:hypothetical protein